MLNLLELQNRYRCMGKIQWGGKVFFKINTDIPFHLNSNTDGFILGPCGRVECYVTSEENIPINANAESIRTSRFGSPRWYDDVLENFYPWPWYPDKKIVSFDCVRCCPGFDEGIFYDVQHTVTEDYLQGRKVTIRIKNVLEYPEFFRPNYID